VPHDTSVTFCEMLIWTSLTQLLRLGRLSFLHQHSKLIYYRAPHPPPLTFCIYSYMEPSHIDFATIKRNSTPSTNTTTAEIQLRPFSDSPNARSKTITTADGLDTFGVCHSCVLVTLQLTSLPGAESACRPKSRIPGWRYRR
jgi:hypothetical protein